MDDADLLQYIGVLCESSRGWTDHCMGILLGTIHYGE